MTFSILQKMRPKLTCKSSSLEQISLFLVAQGAVEPLLLIHANALNPVKIYEVECSALPRSLEG
jgi:hypothetical protein